MPKHLLKDYRVAGHCEQFIIELKGTSDKWTISISLNRGESNEILIAVLSAVGCFPSPCATHVPCRATWFLSINLEQAVLKWLGEFHTKAPTNLALIIRSVKKANFYPFVKQWPKNNRLIKIVAIWWHNFPCRPFYIDLKETFLYKRKPDGTSTCSVSSEKQWQRWIRFFENQGDRISTNTYKTTPISSIDSTYINQNILLWMHINIVYSSRFYLWFMWFLLSACDHFPYTNKWYVISLMKFNMDSVNVWELLLIPMIRWWDRLTMASWTENDFRITAHLCGESTDSCWFPLQ